MAVCAVRLIEQVLVFVRTAASREAYAREMEKTLGIEVRPVATAEACVSEADVVVTITKSAEPVFRADWLAKGAHVNVAGANSADRHEVDAETVLRAAVKATDQIAQAKVEAAEFRDLVAAGKLAWTDVCELGEIVTGKAKGRGSPSEVTLFKSLGIALEDMAFGEVVYQKALAQGVGRPI
jgi:alanine dehydrogenase